LARITAAVTTYNRADFVVDAVESALAQSVEGLVVLVVDDGSTDATAEVLLRFGDRIRYVHQENSGRAEVRNRALRESSGEYIGFLDADDVWLPGKLERQVAVLDEQPDAVLVHGHVDVIDEAGRVLERETAWHRRLFTRAHRRGTSYAAYAFESRCLTSTVLLRRDALERIGGYDPAILVEDVDMYLRIALEGRIVFLESPPLAKYRLHGGQTPNDERTRGHIDLCLKHLQLLDEGMAVPDARTARRNLLLALAGLRYMTADGPAVRRAIRSAVALDPRALIAAPAAKWFLLSLVPPALRRSAGRLRDRLAAAR
jgi:glycosyltransferase involved in cell wall biosynthesis